MSSFFNRFAVVCAASLGILFVFPGSSHLTSSKPSPATASRYVKAESPKAATTVKYEAEILPAGSFSVGTSLSGGPNGSTYGSALTANDIDNAWACSGTCTLDFVFFVFTNQNETAKVEFKVVSPTGGTTYSYTWSSHLTVGSDWYSVLAKGNYGTHGTYFAEVYIGSSLAGWVPVVLSK